MWVAWHGVAQRCVMKTPNNHTPGVQTEVQEFCLPPGKNKCLRYFNSTFSFYLLCLTDLDVWKLCIVYFQSFAIVHVCVLMNSSKFEMSAHF